MFSLRQLLHAWDAFFFAPIPVYTVALVRIALGLVLLVEAVYLAVNAKEYLGPNGLISYARYERRSRGKSLSLFLYLPPTLRSVYAILTLHVVALLCLTLGLFTTVSAVISYITLASIINRNPTIGNGGDNVSRIMLFFLLFASSGHALSLDAHLFYRHLPPDHVMHAPWAMRLMQIQLTIIYLYTAYWKMKGATYRDGTAMYYVLGNYGYRRFPLPKLALRAPYTQWLTWSVLVVEVALPLGLWVTDFRYYAIALGFVLHLVIEYLVSVHLFSFYMMASLLLFVDPYDIQALIQHL